jgi:hypothetical protein
VRRRNIPTDEELAHAEAVWAAVHAMPADTSTPSVPHRRVEASRWAGLVLMLASVGANTRARTVVELEEEWRERRHALGLGEPDLSHNVHALRRALIVAFGDVGMAWGARRHDAGARMDAVALPGFADRSEWEPVVHLHLRRHADDHERMTSLLEVGTLVPEAAAAVRIQGRRALLRRLQELALPATGLPTVREDRARRYDHFCRWCGDAACRSHCRGSTVGEHRSTDGRSCARCGLEVDDGATTPTWSAMEGSPVTWASPPPPTAEELAFESAMAAIEAMNASEEA